MQGVNKKISIKDLAIKISEHLRYEGKILWDKSKPDGTPRKKLDTSILQKLGWEASINLDTGILKTINSYKSELLNNKIRK